MLAIQDKLKENNKKNSKYAFSTKQGDICEVSLFLATSINPGEWNYENSLAMYEI